ncbi:hypothetical protein CC80DRAFT_493487 [Byssothecium circinans]|uniref:Uncharacterized protein n=1 Tax=Byssothecium circinans TaxID=147558 RepID=A0A6A5TQK2_9PLEO|nr:hypothetical protein CC80DRAFT_493487 [Byssothecium circinans]
MPRKKNFSAMKRMEKTKGKLPPGKADESLATPQVLGTDPAPPRTRGKKKKAAPAADAEQSITAHHPSPKTRGRSLEPEMPSATGEVDASTQIPDSKRVKFLDSLSKYAAARPKDAAAAAEKSYTILRRSISAAQVAPLWKPENPDGEFSRAFHRPGLHPPMMQAKQEMTFEVPKVTIWTPLKTPGSYEWWMERLNAQVWNQVRKDILNRTVSLCTYFASLDLKKDIRRGGSDTHTPGYLHNGAVEDSKGPTIFDVLSRRTKGDGSDAKPVLPGVPKCTPPTIEFDYRYYTTFLGNISFRHFLSYFPDASRNRITERDIVQAFICCFVDELYGPDVCDEETTPEEYIDRWGPGEADDRIRLGHIRIKSFLELVPFERVRDDGSGQEEGREKISVTEMQLFGAWEKAVRLEEKLEKEKKAVDNQKGGFVGRLGLGYALKFAFASGIIVGSLWSWWRSGG